MPIILFSLLYAAATISFLAPSYKMLEIVGLLGTTISLFLFFSELRKFKIGRGSIGLLVFLAGNIFWFWKEVAIFSFHTPSFPNIISISPVAGVRFPEELVGAGLFMLASFNFCALLSWNFSRGAHKYVFRAERQGRNGFIFDGTLLVIAALGWWPFLQTFGGIDQALFRLLMMRTEVVEHVAGFKNYLPIASIVVAGIALSRLVTGSAKSNLLTIFTIFVGGLIAVLSGTRFKLIYLAMPALVCAFIALQNPEKRRRSLIFIWVLFLCMVSLASFQFASRYANTQIETGLLAATGGSDHFAPLLFAIDLMDSREYFNQSMLVLFVTDMIPRFIWEGKPDHDYWNYYNEIAFFGNVTPSVVGQYFLNWGLFGGAISGVIFGFWARAADILLECYRDRRDYSYLILSAFTATFLFLSFRHYTLNYGIFLFVAAIVILLTLPRVGRRRLRMSSSMRRAS